MASAAAVRTTLSPQDWGCRCDICPLGPAGQLRKEEWRPVGPELHEGATVLAVAESPGPDEVRYGRPLVGRSGHEWNTALLSIGRSRPEVDLANVIACRPPGAASGAWLRMTKEIDGVNKGRSRQGLEPLPHPSTCCRPMLLGLASNYAHIITMGKSASTAITGRQQSIIATRGGPVGIDENFCITDVDEAKTKVLPILHPAFVLRSPSWRPVLHSDLAKAFRFFAGELRWTQPVTTWRPGPDALRLWLKQPAPFFAYDVETDGIEPLTAGLRTIAIATPDLNAEGRPAKVGEEIVTPARAVGVSLLSADGYKRFYDKDNERQIREVLAWFFTDPRFVKVGHNAGSYDRMVIEHHFSVTPAPLVDTLFLARFRSPDLPKGLKTVGSILTDVDRWETTEKGTKISTGSHDDDELLRYNIIDSTVNARIVAPLVASSETVGAFRPINELLKPSNWPADKSFNLCEVDHATQDMCVGMHKAGIWVDQEMRWALEIEYEASVKRRKARLAELVNAAGLNRLDVAAVDYDDDYDGESRFKPGSYDQVRNLLYTKWDLGIPSTLEAKDFYTQSGLPGTNDVVLRAHLASGNLDPLQEEFVRELRLYRREKNKILGTVLYRMRTKMADPKLGRVWSDGRVRSSWNAHVTSVGRLSSSAPNLQNIGNRKGQGRLKGIFAAPAGRILIGADLDQAHLRVIANYWKIPLLLECFTAGKDPHNTLAYQVFGDKFKSAGGWGPEGFSLHRKPTSGQAKSMRDVIKTFRYASIYGANPITVWQVLTSTETDDARMPYLKMTQREVRLIHQTWMETEPEWARAWKTMVGIWGKHHHMEEPVFSRRSGPLSAGKLNEVVNYPVLAAESSLMRLAEHAIMDAFPFDYAGPSTGLIHQCHDSVAVEVPLPKEVKPNWRPRRGEPLPPTLERQRRIVEEAMTIRIPGWEVALTAEADVGRTLKEI